MKGTAFMIKCPKCHRGQYGHAPRDKGVRRTGRVELKLSSGANFYGHRGEVECLDCGHKWYSTHPASGRVRAGDLGGYKGAAKDFAEAKREVAKAGRASTTTCQCGGRLLPKVLGGMALYKEEGRYRLYDVQCEDCGVGSVLKRTTPFPALPPRKAKDCRVCGGDGWTERSAELRWDGRRGDTTCIGCGGAGKETS